MQIQFYAEKRGVFKNLFLNFELTRLILSFKNFFGFRFAVAIQLKEV